MRTAIATVCLSGTLSEKIDAAAAAGFDGVEIFEPDLLVSPLSPEDVRARCADLGLSIDLYQPFRDADGVADDAFASVLHRARAKFELMNRLGAPMALVCSNVGTATVDDDDVSAEQLSALGDLAEEFGVRLAYEALAWGRFVGDYRHAQHIVDLAGHRAVGTCLDSFHILSRHDDPSGIEDIPADKIFFVQLADAPDLSMDVLSWSRHHRVFPGQGAWDLPAFMTHLVRAGYTGPVSLEIFNDVFRQSDVTRTAVDARRSLRWLEERTIHCLSAQGQAAPADYVGLPEVPDPSGFDFAEIRVADTADVGALLRGIGFTDEGPHRTKDVRLWSLGDAHVCVNAGDASPGEPAYLSGLGFLVDSPADAARRAHELGSPEVPRRTNSDEHLLRGVAAPDGTEVFFCTDSAAWTPEFGPAPAAVTVPGTEAEPAATRAWIDHVNLAQPWHCFDEAVLFFASALSLDPLPAHDVAGPLGLVRSQVMRSDDGAVRIPLNLAPTAAAASGPHGAQHIAIRVDDIVTLARGARDRGLEFLPVPANYYDDLAARFELGEDDLATLRELDLLYDRDGDGEFVHFFTGTVGGVFLEVLERRGGYDGYGAPNAPVRLAAQHALFEETTGRAPTPPPPPGP